MSSVPPRSSSTVVQAPALPSPSKGLRPTALPKLYRKYVVSRSQIISYLRTGHLEQSLTRALSFRRSAKPRTCITGRHPTKTCFRQTVARFSLVPAANVSRGSQPRPLDLIGVDGISAIMPRPVLDISYQCSAGTFSPRRHFIETIADRFDDMQVGALAVAANIIRLARFTFSKTRSRARA